VYNIERATLWGDMNRYGGDDDLLPSGSPPSAAESAAPSTEVRRKAIGFKVSHILVTGFFVWLLYAHRTASRLHADHSSAAHLIGILFFAKGFLLTRLVLDNKSECATLPSGERASERAGCWHPKTFERAVIVIIDALRYDFTVPANVSLGEDVPRRFYHDNLPLLYDVAVSHPENAFLLPFIADPPTSTLQRLKGLTTGTLPTFIDVGSNFAGTAIEEDNLISQLKDAGKTVVHLGDDTWHSLFPRCFDENLTHAYDSFNVWDLHTVDNGVIEHIMPLLDQSAAPWDVIIAHFLGVDHAGHRYGPDHPAMADKLQQMNGVLHRIVDRLDDGTLLVVMGDHGMDTKGDHGGESDEEVEAALWMYSKTRVFGRTDRSVLTPPATAKERPVGQIDLVSTLSLLLGLPIPFNNLGTPIAEAFTGPGKTNWQNLARVDLLAFEQIQRYQQEYSRSRELEVDEDQHSRSLHVQALRSGSRSPAWEEVHSTYGHWHTETIAMYRRLWAHFNVADMLHGIEISSFALALLFVFARLSKGDKSDAVPGTIRNIGIGTLFGALLGLVASLAFPHHFTRAAGAIWGAITVGSIAAGIFFVQKGIISTGPAPSLWTGLMLIFCVSQAAGFASNSYTIHEDTILLFFLTTFGAVAVVSSLRQASPSDRVLGVYQSALFVLLTRAASFSRLCREEQMPGCRSTFYASSTSSTSAPWQLLIPYAVALILPEIIKAFYQSTASYAASAGFWIGFAFRIGLLLVAAYWTIDAVDNGGWLLPRVSQSTLQTIKVSVARCALAVAIPVGIGTFVWAQPCIDISLTSDPVKGEIDPARRRVRPQIVILGYANTYGCRYFLMIPILVLSVALLLPPMGQYSIAICTWQILCLLEILDTNGLAISSSNSSVGPIVLAMLGSYHFFKTGHQAVLSSIQWNSAFVPLRTIQYPWSPLLVVLNTFGAQIICAAAVPLTVLWKRPISKHGLRGVWSDVMTACLTHALYYATIHLATTLWAGHLRRHLMLYRVFMPRYLMASGVLLIIDLVLVLIALPSVRVAGLSVGEVFGY